MNLQEDEPSNHHENEAQSPSSLNYNIPAQNWNKAIILSSLSTPSYLVEKNVSSSFCNQNLKWDEK